MFENITLATVIYAGFGGLLPALFWLWFFLREDKAHPEPKSLIMLAFVVGMLSVLLVLPIEHWILEAFEPSTHLYLWAAAEELVKFFVALLAVLWRNALDEPIDAIVYMVTVALGFAALETALFLLAPFADGDTFSALLTGNLRFLGAALIHTISSAVVGVAIAFSFYKPHPVQAAYISGGLVLATVLHALFNQFILFENGTFASLVFFVVWVGVVGLFVAFEKAKIITRN